MVVCDFNCFECIYPDCIYDSLDDESGQYFDYSVSREIDSSLRTPDYKKENYYQKNREKINERSRKYRQEHKEEINAKRRKYYQDNKEVMCARQREYYRKCFVYGLGRKLRSSKKSSQNSEL